MKLSLVYALSAGLFTGYATAEDEPYLYGIYYGGGVCDGTVATLRGYSSGQAVYIEGHRANATTTGDLCPLESLCLIDPLSHQCAKNDYVKTASVVQSLEDGLIYECDNSNPGAECAILDGCYGSSSYPNCNFQLISTSALVKNPSAIQHADPANEPALVETSYIVYYSDDTCTNVEGIEGYMNNGTNTVAVTDETVSCRDAMACAFHPESGELGESCQKVLGVDTPPTIDWTLASIADGQAVPCEGETCTPISPDTCQKSPIHASCHYRIAPAAVLYANPGDFLKNYVLDDATTTTTTTTDATDAPQATADTTEAPATTNGEATEVPSGAVTGKSLLALVCGLAMAVVF